MDVKPDFELVEVPNRHQSHSDENSRINNEIQEDPEFASDPFSHSTNTNSIFIKQEVSECDYNSVTNKPCGLHECKDSGSTNIKQEECEIKEENTPQYEEEPFRMPAGSNSKIQPHRTVLKAAEMVQNVLKAKNKKGKYKCTICDYETRRKTIFTHHLRMHTGEKPFSCTFCGYKSSQKSHLTQHQKIHTGEKPYTCTFCDYRSFRKNVLMVHIRTHTGEKPFKCTFCNYACSQRTHLTQHMRSHTGEKPYVCILCNYKGVHKTDLTRHLRTHTGEKPYNCTLCDYKCSQKCTLTEHLKIHTGAKPFKCSACGYKCARKSDLTRHQRIHSGEKPFAQHFLKHTQKDRVGKRKKACLGKMEKSSSDNKLISNVLLKCEFGESCNSTVERSSVTVKEEVIYIKKEN